MTPPTHRCSIRDIRTAIKTREHLNKLDRQFPNFVHKWTKEKRTYSFNDLYLPEYIHIKGQQIPFHGHFIAIGGTRSPAVETFCLVSSIVREIAENGISILSGGVPGVDLAAHLAATEVPGGTTFAVLANPVEMGLKGHEWSNSQIESSFLEHGGFISEYSTYCHFDSEEFRERLLARGRIITGLSDLLIIFECNVDSATVDTARRALAQGKPVICIDTTKKTLRRGVDQLANELGLTVLREDRLSIRQIVAAIMGLFA